MPIVWTVSTTSAFVVFGGFGSVLGLWIRFLGPTSTVEEWAVQ